MATCLASYISVCLVLLISQVQGFSLWSGPFYTITSYHFQYFAISSRQVGPGVAENHTHKMSLKVILNQRACAVVLAEIINYESVGGHQTNN